MRYRSGVLVLCACSNKPLSRVLSATQRAPRPDDVIAKRKYLRGESDDVRRADVRAQPVVGGGVSERDAVRAVDWAGLNEPCIRWELIVGYQ